MRTGVYRDAVPEARRAAHAALAAAAAARGEAGALAAARHRAAATDGQDEDVAAALHGAARIAVHGSAEAAALAHRAALMTPDPALRAPRRIEAGGLAMLAGQPELARTSSDAAIEEAADPQILIGARSARAPRRVGGRATAPAHWRCLLLPRSLNLSPRSRCRPALRRVRRVVHDRDR
ncbi:MAG: hypothetical protein U0237_15260 [Thermoleophilia bacterium]